MIRAMVFVDGTWLYYGRGDIQSEERQLNLDYGKLPKLTTTKATDLLGQPIDLVRTWIFGSYVTNCDDRDADLARKQKDFLKSVRNRYGHSIRQFPIDFKGRRLREADRDAADTWSPREKEVDIALATALVSNAFCNAYDLAILVIGDRDFSPAIEEVRKSGKRVIIASLRDCCCREYADEEAFGRLRDAPVVWLDEIIQDCQTEDGTPLAVYEAVCNSPYHQGERKVKTAVPVKENYMCDECRARYDREYEELASVRRWPEEGTRVSGVVKKLVPKRGFGFLQDENHNDFFFHISNLVDVDYNDLREGMPVTFLVKRIGETGHAGVAEKVIKG